MARRNEIVLYKETNMEQGLALALDVFLSNWLLVPLFLERSFTDGALIGVIAALLILGFYGITR